MTLSAPYRYGWESQSPLRVVQHALLGGATHRAILDEAAQPIDPRGKEDDFPPFEMMAAAAVSEGNIWADYRKNRCDWLPQDLKEKHGQAAPRQKRLRGRS